MGPYPWFVDANAQDDLGFGLSVVLRSYLDAASDVFCDVPGGARGYQVIASASRETPPTQLALAQQLGIDRSVLTYLLDDLERAKLIERQPDQADRRARRIVVTRLGVSMLVKMRKRLEAAEQHALRGLDNDEGQALRGLIARAASVETTNKSACDVVDEVARTIAR